MRTDLPRHPVLFVDDEPPLLAVYRYMFADRISILTAGSSEEALALLREHDVAVLVTDERMPEMRGVELCARAREMRPDAIRILVTAYADIGAAIAAINDGQISRYVQKPWGDQEMLDLVEASLRLFDAERTARDLRSELLGVGPAHLAAALHRQLAHEIDSPLSLLSLAIEDGCARVGDLVSTLDGVPVAQRIATEVRTMRDDLVTTVDTLLTICARHLESRGSGDPRARSNCEPGRVIETTARLVRREVERTARLELALASCRPVAIDRATLAQMVLNLIRNAAQAIEGQSRTDGRIQVALVESGSEAILTVADDGPGVTAAAVQSIFMPGITTKANGSGLGLFIVRALARAAGGDASLVDGPGPGATFEVRLPLGSP